MRWLPLLLMFAFDAAAAETVSGRVVHVLDGDTLKVLDGANRRYKVRLAGVDAPEVKQAFGIESARSLARLCHQKTAKVEWKEKERSLHIAQVTCDGADANAEQVRHGMAWVSPRGTSPGSALYELETYARLRKVGLWADDKAVPPWEWRSPKTKQ